MPVHDLTHPIADGMPTYPGDPPVAVAPHATHAEDGYRVSRLGLGTHAGTHVDAPAHTEPDGATLDALDVARFRFDARVVRVDVDANEAIERADLPAGADADLLVLDTGWHRHWGTDRYADHPHLAPAAAAWCADRGLDVAIDAFSVDPTPAERVPAHHALLGAGQLVVENLANLADLPERVTVHAYPLPVAGGDGGPARVVAVEA